MDSTIYCNQLTLPLAWFFLHQRTIDASQHSMKCIFENASYRPFAEKCNFLGTLIFIKKLKKHNHWKNKITCVSQIFYFKTFFISQTNIKSIKKKLKREKFTTCTLGQYIIAELAVNEEHRSYVHHQLFFVPRVTLTKFLGITETHTSCRMRLKTQNSYFFVSSSTESVLLACSTDRL